MVLTNSTMLPLGISLPPFDLAVLQGASRFGDDAQQKGFNRISSNTLGGKPLLFMMICVHCPFVKHVEEGLKNLDKDYGDLVEIFAVASNSLITHPEDGPEFMEKQVRQRGWQFPYLIDSSQNFAKALKAACTPEFFLFGPLDKGEHLLKYRGQLDDSRPGNKIPVTGIDLRTALNDVLADKEVCYAQKPSIGCNIKWHPGEEPSWFG